MGLLACEALLFLLAVNALWPRTSPAELGIASFFLGWLTSELSLHLFLLNAVVTIFFLRAGLPADRLSQMVVGLSTATAVLLLFSLRLSARGRSAIAGALEDFAPASRGLEWRQLLFPLPVTHPEVERVRDVVYFDDGQLRLRVDIWRRRGDDGEKRPALIYAHGGGWVIGHRRYQGLPTLQRMASRGWVCFSVQYRLSPRATFPDHVIDLKRAIAWVRAHAAEWGVDPEFIAVAGGSAGGHLASLAALTPNRAEWQPGFEQADTRVQACVSYYGVYDFTNRFGHWRTDGLRRLLEQYVLKASFDEARERFDQASPISHVGAHAPPFVLAHGTRDTVVPVDEARSFAAALRAKSIRRVVYLEVPGAQHAFEIFPSLRTVAVLDGVERFLTHVHEEVAGVMMRASL